MNKDILVKKSEIIGKGVFAARNFKKDEVVLRWKPKQLSKTQLNKLSDKEKHYVLEDKDIYYLMQKPERYINHSCNPNTIVHNLSDKALREIKKGEEITSDYGNYPYLNFMCKCNSINCKKIIGIKSRRSK